MPSLIPTLPVQTNLLSSFSKLWRAASTRVEFSRAWRYWARKLDRTLQLMNNSSLVNNCAMKPLCKGSQLHPPLFCFSYEHLSSLIIPERLYFSASETVWSEGICWIFKLHTGNALEGCGNISARPALICANAVPKNNFKKETKRACVHTCIQYTTNPI